MTRILVIDVGGTFIKYRVTGNDKESFPSGPEMTAAEACRGVLERIPPDSFDAVTIGYPGPVKDGCIVQEPELLGAGWVRADYRLIFGKPVRIVNDAAMQAMGAYRGSRMLFLGLGTGLGTCLISNFAIVSLELANLPYRGLGRLHSYGGYLGIRSLNEAGRSHGEWTEAVWHVAELLKDALVADEVVIGGGNANHLKEFPEWARRGNNEDALRGGELLWADARFKIV